MTQDTMATYDGFGERRIGARRGFSFLSEMPVCHLCDRPVEACACVCPYCGDRDGCRCCIGYGLALGGD